MKKSFFILLAGILMMGSCKSYKDIPYFTNIPVDSLAYFSGYRQASVPYKPLLIKPDDILQIDIDIMDNKLSALSSTRQTSSAALVEAEARGVTGYLVDQDGNINLPLLGTVRAAGKTTNSLKDEIQTRAATYYNNPVVNVRLSNFEISVLGEVNRPGTYYIRGERASILDALGLAGDMTIYGRRDNIMLIRQHEEGQHIYRFNINDGQVLSSPFFYLQQNDVVYVEPSEAKAAQTDAQRMQWLSFSASIATIIAVLLTRLF